MRLRAPIKAIFAVSLALAVASCGGGPTEPATGSLAVVVSGLPDGVPAALTLQRPDGSSQPVSGSDTLAGLPAGEYTLAASSVTASGSGYAPSPATQSVTVSSGEAPAQTAVSYSLSTGSLEVIIAGLPPAAAAAVTVTGGSATLEITSTTTLTGLLPGAYTVTAANVPTSSGTYSPTQAQQTVTVVAAVAPVATTVAYAARPGELDVTITGLPEGIRANVTITGPDGYRQAVTNTTTLTRLTPGSYTVTAEVVEAGGKSYQPGEASQPVTLTADESVGVTVAYGTVAVSSLNLRIDALYLVQSTQDHAGTVPLVAGRDALLRVFVVASQSNDAAPAVRVRLFDGTTPAATFTIPAPGSGVPSSVSEASLVRSWNLPLSGALIQPGLQIVADVDPGEAVAETDETDNGFPADGTPRALDVRAVPPFAVTFVPLRQTDGQTGGVGSSNKEQFLALAQRVHPLNAVDATVHATLDVDTTVSPADIDAWASILSRVQMLRVTEGSDRYYYGVLKVDYCNGGGLAGIGFIGLGSAVGWDCERGGSFAEVAAHEWGHNWGREHSPGCGASDPDPNYPYAAARIGVFGYDPASGSVQDTSFSDIMAYCTPEWISDYTYRGILDFRATQAAQAAQLSAAIESSAAAEPCLVVWGRVVDGRPVLEPAFEVVTRPRLPRRSGPYSIEGEAGDGGSLFRLSFTPPAVADLPAGTSAFAFAVPLRSAGAPRLASLRLTTGTGAAAVMRRAAAAERLGRRGLSEGVQMGRRPDGRLSLRWDSRAHPALLARDPRTGEVLAVGRNGAAVLQAGPGEVELILSDGVRSRAERVAVGH